MSGIRLKSTVIKMKFLVFWSMTHFPEAKLEFAYTVNLKTKYDDDQTTLSSAMKLADLPINLKKQCKLSSLHL